MARRTTVTLVDDLDGTPADGSLEFSIDGRSYGIDLSTANLKRLRDALAPYVAAARRTGGPRGSGRGPAPGRTAAARAQTQAIRQWATTQEMTISERGRIPSNVLDAYHQAH